VAIQAQRGDWTVPQFAEALGIPRSTVLQYVLALERGGFVKRIREPEKTQAGTLPATWRRSARHTKPPMVSDATGIARAQLP
jgi:DNA-binding IclR family transcriptional regulator